MQRHSPAIRQLVAVLAQATQQLEASGAIDPTLRRAAREEAHKLAGSIGAFGFHRVCQIASGLEVWLHQDRPIAHMEKRRIIATVRTLQEELA